MTRTTFKQRDASIDRVNERLEELGSKMRFTMFQPWSHELLSRTTVGDSGITETYNQSTSSQVYDAMRLVGDILYQLQREGILPKARS